MKQNEIEIKIYLTVIKMSILVADFTFIKNVFKLKFSRFVNGNLKPFMLKCLT